jgi:hypothetical protein
VECLQGIRLEFKGAYDDALAMYHAILGVDPTNTVRQRHLDNALSIA